MSPGDVFENWKRSTQAVVMPVELGLTSTDSGSIYFLRELVSVVETTVVVSSSTKRYIFLIVKTVASLLFDFFQRFLDIMFSA